MLGRFVVDEFACRSKSADSQAESLVAKGPKLSFLVGGLGHAIEALSSKDGRVLGAASRR